MNNAAKLLTSWTVHFKLLTHLDALRANLITNEIFNSTSSNSFVNLNIIAGFRLDWNHRCVI